MEKDYWCYRYLDHLPKIPQKFVDAALEIAHDVEKSSIDNALVRQREQTKHRWFRSLDVYGHKQASRTVFRYKVSDEFEQWIRDNITDEFNDAALGLSIANDENSDVTGAHTDTTRPCLLLYVIETSNPGQKTVWWQEKEKPVVRELDYYPSDFDNLEKIEEVEYETGRWVAMNSTIIHSIHNVKKFRNAFHISLPYDPMTRAWAHPKSNT